MRLPSQARLASGEKQPAGFHMRSLPLRRLAGSRGLPSVSVYHVCVISIGINSYSTGRKGLGTHPPPKLIPLRRLQKQTQGLAGRRTQKRVVCFGQ